MTTKNYSINLQLICLSAIITFALSLTLSAQENYKEITIYGSELHPITSKINNRPYQLMVVLPPSYKVETSKKYPVLFVTDGYWDVRLVNAMVSNLLYDKAIPEFILVGLGYSDEDLIPDNERMFDMTPKELEATGIKTSDKAIGGAEDFLKFIESEAIPYIENHFRIDPEYRVFGGSSLGGFFNLYTMFTNTELFDAYIAISPATGIAFRWLFSEEAKYRNINFWERNNTCLPARLFMSGAENEWFGFFGDILAFNEILTHGEYENFSYQFRIIDEEGHAGTKAEGYSRGIRYAFKPYLDRLAHKETSIE